jgi:ankyrin repeat protein
MQDIFEKECEQGNYNAAKELYAQHPDKISIHYWTFCVKCSEGKLNTVKTWYECDKSRLHFGKALLSACEKNQMDVVIWLFSLKKDFGCQLQTSFILCCTNNYLDIATFISRQSTITDETLNKGLVKCCEKNNFIMAQWVHSLGANIHYKDWYGHDGSFLAACREGNFKIAKWLHSLGANIATRDHIGGKAAYRSGNAEIKNWVGPLLNMMIIFSS